jgi:hypothetical protein
MEDIESIESLLIDLSTLRLATDNFSEKNKLGEGGFGEVYKVEGTIVPPYISSYVVHLNCHMF